MPLFEYVALPRGHAATADDEPVSFPEYGVGAWKPGDVKDVTEDTADALRRLDRDFVRELEADEAQEYRARAEAEASAPDAVPETSSSPAPSDDAAPLS